MLRELWLTNIRLKDNHSMAIHEAHLHHSCVVMVQNCHMSLFTKTYQLVVFLERVRVRLGWTRQNIFFGLYSMVIVELWRRNTVCPNCKNPEPRTVSQQRLSDLRRNQEMYLKTTLTVTVLWLLETLHTRYGINSDRQSSITRRD